MNMSIVIGVLFVAVTVQVVNTFVVGLGLGGLGGIGGIGLQRVGLLGGVGLQTGLGLQGVVQNVDGDIGGLDAADVVDAAVALPITGCRCMAVNSRNPDVVVRDFGIIQACGALTLCGCNAIGVRSCRRVCQQVVEVWADNACPLALKNTEVRAAFQSTLCAAGMGDGAAACDGNGLTGIAVPLLPNLIL